jgi:serine/threonine protein kinase
MLGKGGFGEVFEGNWRGTKVAIKRIAYFHPAVSEAMYMSPEQMKFGITNEKTDVYSFGMTIYEVRKIAFFTKIFLTCSYQIFSGIPPFKDAISWTSLRKDVVDFSDRPSKPQRQADVDRGLDDELWNLIVDCWSQEPSKRPMAATVSSTLNNCAIKPTFAQACTTSTAGKAGEIIEQLLFCLRLNRGPTRAMLAILLSMLLFK